MATLLVSVYVFVAFFAVHLHHHKSSLEFRDFQLEKASDSFTDSSAALEYSDCLACHLLHDSSNLIPQEFHFHTVLTEVIHVQAWHTHTDFSTQMPAVVTLRGPPSLFI